MSLSCVERVLQHQEEKKGCCGHQFDDQKDHECRGDGSCDGNGCHNKVVNNTDDDGALGGDIFVGEEHF